MATSAVLAALGMAAGKVIIKKQPNLCQITKPNLYLLQSNFTKLKNEDVRFSISYLIRIKIPSTSKFLLVRGHRIKDQLQPVGGVYKNLTVFQNLKNGDIRKIAERRE